MKPEVSIVIPLYNKAPYVGRTLTSIQRQTFSNFEVLVVDDGSTDGGADIVSAAGDSRVRLIRQRNRGPGAARNAGIKEAGAEFIAFLDADDEWLPEYLERGLAILKSGPLENASVTCGYFTSPGESSRQLCERRGLSEGQQRLTIATPPELIISILAYMTPCSTIVRRGVLEKWGGFYSDHACKYGEDAYLFLKILLNEAVTLSLEPLVRINCEASRLSRNVPGARPVEPFLTDPAGIYADCPDPLRNVLSRVLRLRALKTACVLGYWGQWREARELLRRFDRPIAWQHRYYVPSLICRTPLAGMIRHFALL